jgi:hypothetical protein
MKVSTIVAPPTGNRKRAPFSSRNARWRLGLAPALE